MCKIIRIFLSVVCVCVANACKSHLDTIVNNNPHLSNLYNEYPDSKQKRESLYFIVKNSKCSDIKLFDLDSLKMNVDLAYEQWTTSSWVNQYHCNYFSEYVLPMRIADEPLEYYWRCDAKAKIVVDSEGVNIRTVAKKINSRIIINTSPDSFGNQQMGYTKTIAGNYGKCDDRAILTAMTLRAYGIPAAYEYIPYWGSVNNGHSVCSAIMPNDSILVFQSHNDGEDVFMVQKTPKVYRRMFTKQDKSLLYKYRNNESIPPQFSDFRFIDVTELHAIGMSDTNVSITNHEDSKLIYLSVFSPQHWVPISFTERYRDKANFKNMGNGANQHGENPVQGENIGDGILYLPSYYIDGKIIAAADPYVLSKSGCRKIVCDTDRLESVTLTRKYPLLNRLKNYAKAMNKGVFEVANNPDFSDAKVIHTIKSTPLCRLQSVNIDLDRRVKYIRYRKPQGVFSIAELKIYDKSGTELNGNLIATKALIKDENIKMICDGDPLTYYHLQGTFDAWAGIELPKASEIGYIEFAPRNDDNAISVGDRYELFYWNGEWIGLGEKEAETYSIQYDNVPKGALLWLRNRTRGREERPFTYDNGKQIWW